MKYISYLLIVVVFVMFNSCKVQQTSIKTNSFAKVKFIGEKVIPDGTIFKNTVVGGLSSIDFANGKYYLISDDKKKPVRFYEMQLTYNEKGFESYEITNVTSISSEEKFIDPEALRYDKTTGNFFWTSEGAIRKGISPTIFEIDSKGNSIRKLRTPNIFLVDGNKETGPRRNGTFEGMTLSEDGNYIWIGMELPLKQDGEEPQLQEGKYPVRITKIDKKTNEVKFQFVYMLDRIPKDSKPSGKFLVNGLPEILALGNSKFIFVERAYASGHKNGGNTVKLFLVDANKATDIKDFQELRTAEYIPASKKLLFDFEAIRSKLTRGIVDNLEGITFGQTLANGHRTIVLVSDNNFSKFSPQLNQIIILELVE